MLFWALVALAVSCQKETVSSGDLSSERISFSADAEVTWVCGNGATKGVPVTDSNLTSPTGPVTGLSVRALKGGADYFSGVELATYDGGIWQTADSYFWPADDSSIDFWSWAPADMPVDDMVISGNILSFSYTLPQTCDATSQPDLVFAYKQQHKSGDHGNVDLEFKHALSAVQFKFASTFNGKITDITLRDVVRSGSCQFGTDGNFAWTLSEEKGTCSQTFDVSTTADDPTIAKAVTSADDGTVFMMIPQDATAITLEFTFNDERYTSTISGNWLPGQAYTYVIKLFGDKVSVDINEDFDGETKENVTFTNSGRVAVFVRAAIVGNWVDANGKIVKGWTMTSGTFAGLCASGWEKRSDGFFYYAQSGVDTKIEKGEETEPLFTEYTPSAPPAEGLHLEMKILVQAVEAGEETSFADAVTK